MDICRLSTSDNPANFPVCAGICLSHLNSNHANIAIVPNGFHCTIIAEHTNSYGVNESFFPVHSRKTKFSFTSPGRMIWVHFYRLMVFMEAYSCNDWLEVSRGVSKNDGPLHVLPQNHQSTTFYPCRPHSKHETKTRSSKFKEINPGNTWKQNQEVMLI